MRPPLELLLFHIDPSVVARADRAGIDGFVVDWERRGKARRQAGEGTQINSDTLADLQRVRAATGRRVICRVNGFGPWTRREINDALDAGVDEILLPMVSDPHHVDEVLRLVAGRCGLGILIETQAGVAAAAELLQRPLSRVYIGLNDLRIDRGSTDLFTPLIDGTVESLRELSGAHRFGVAGLTVPRGGRPIPTRLLAAELRRIGADFTFLRRSFLADTAGEPLGPAVRGIHRMLAELAARDAASIDVDREGLVRGLTHGSALSA